MSDKTNGRERPGEEEAQVLHDQRERKRIRLVSHRDVLDSLPQFAREAQESRS
jgi:hypothetical protein